MGVCSDILKYLGKVYHTLARKAIFFGNAVGWRTQTQLESASPEVFAMLNEKLIDFLAKILYNSNIDAGIENCMLPLPLSAEEGGGWMRNFNQHTKCSAHAVFSGRTEYGYIF